MLYAVQFSIDSTQSMQADEVQFPQFKAQINNMQIYYCMQSTKTLSVCGLLYL